MGMKSRRNQKSKPVFGRLAIDWPFEETKTYRCIQEIGGLALGEVVRIKAQNFHNSGIKDDISGSEFLIVAQRIHTPKPLVRFGIDSKKTADRFFEIYAGRPG